MGEIFAKQPGHTEGNAADPSLRPDANRSFINGIATLLEFHLTFLNVTRK